MTKMSLNPLVAIIVLNWNGSNDTIECINSLRKLTYNNKKIIVVDNASRIDDLDRLKIFLAGSTDIIQNKENLGYAQGNNVGLNWAKDRYNPDFYWFLNNDTVVDSGALSELINYARYHTEVGIIGSYIKYWQSPLIYCLGGGQINIWTGIDHLWGARLDYHKAFVPKKFSYISGCSLFLSKTVLKSVKGFDSDYFLYSEEADLCLRAARLGHQLGYVPSSIVYHKLAQSAGYYSPTYIYYFLRNKLIFMKKNAKWWHWVIFLPVFIFYYIGGFTWRCWLKNRYLPFRIIAQSISDFISGRFAKQTILLQKHFQRFEE